MLRDEIKTLSGNKRRFLLLRIVDMDKKTALQLCGVTQGTYNTWLQSSEFIELHRRISEFSGEHKQEAIQLLRRDNQLAAVLLEGKIVHKMKQEIESGEYELIRTNLARAVYERLIGDLDIQPQVKSLTWESRIQQLFVGNQPQLQEGEVIDGDTVSETVSITEEQHQESFPIQEGEQTP